MYDEMAQRIAQRFAADAARDVTAKVDDIREAMKRIGFLPTTGKSSGRVEAVDYEWKQEFKVRGSDVGSLVVFYYPNLD